MVLTPNALFGLMDHLYILQRFPEEYMVEVQGVRGFITIIIWAHYVLDLTVKVMIGGTVGTLGQHIRFGRGITDQVIICWEMDLDDVEIQLLDSKMQVVLQAISEADSGSTALLSASAERVTL